MILSDGMGSGPIAAMESEAIVDSIGSLLESGFSKELAVNMLNAMVSFRSQGNRFTTLDLCVIDMYCARAEFIKLGALTTFIKRNDWIETIASTSLPVGTVENAKIDSSDKKLYNGDFIIMVSDGVIDGIIFKEKEDYIKELILRINTDNPQELADSIRWNISKMNGERFKDDVSVLVTKITHR